VRERGRMRKRGASGGGTLRRKSPQQGQRPSLPRGVVASGGRIDLGFVLIKTS